MSWGGEPRTNLTLRNCCPAFMPRVASTRVSSVIAIIYAVTSIVCKNYNITYVKSSRISVIKKVISAGLGPNPMFLVSG